MIAGLSLRFAIGAFCTMCGCGARTSLGDGAGSDDATTDGAIDAIGSDGDAEVDTRPDVPPPQCGNGIVEVGELCDDGNLDEDDGCTSRCGPASCGDGLPQRTEQCDDGNRDDRDDCLSSCALARCGDGFVRTGGEQCDDGNTIDDDACDNGCRLPVCGDGKRAGREECDLGADNGDKPAFLISQRSGTRIGTNPIYRPRTAVAFYDYRSASSHTGFEQVGESRIYLYVDTNTGRLSLVLTHGIDFDGTGLSQPDARVDFDVAGIPPGFAIDVADDSGSEFFATGPSTAAGRWVFGRNSDGGVLGGLPFPGAFKITVTPRFRSGLTRWGWVRDDLMRIPMLMSEPITIEAFAEGSRCRSNCTVPRCGDRILDGGEVCDDGNVIGGDGCAADCKSTR